VDALGLLRVLAISSFPVAVYSLFIPIQNIRMKVENIVVINGLRCVLLLGLSYVLMEQYGIIGAGYGWMITYGVISLVIGGMVRKERWI
jgi:O-antigen/teichoic acid export membrane protein